jgi:hypothetical protein
MIINKIINNFQINIINTIIINIKTIIKDNSEITIRIINNKINNMDLMIIIKDKITKEQNKIIININKIIITKVADINNKMLKITNNMVKNHIININKEIHLIRIMINNMDINIKVINKNSSRLDNLNINNMEIIIHKVILIYNNNNKTLKI